MKERADWQYDEMAEAGHGHGEVEVAKRYDVYHRRFRDIDVENDHILQMLEPQADQTVLDMGAGTGFFSLAASERYAQVIAVDISTAMLDVAREKALRKNCANIEFQHGGFLTYEHVGDPVDAVVSQLALHHLPDFWKYAALVRLAAILNEKGMLYLADTVFTDMTKDYQTQLKEIVTGRNSDVEGLQEAVTRHIREEFTTMDWIMEGLLIKAGFVIEQKQYHGNFWAEYLCSKKSVSELSRRDKQRKKK